MGHVATCPEDGRLSIWYDRPATALSRYVTAYDAYRTRLGPGELATDLFPPAWASIRFTLTPEPWAVKLGRRLYDPVPRDALFGPSSRAGFSRFGNGWVVCAGLTPLGWARFVGRNAAAFADRVTPLETIWPDHAPALRAALEAEEDSAAVFDAFFAELMRHTLPESPVVGRMTEELLDPELLTIAELARRLDMTAREVARVSTQHFGFTPKLLIRRARFMRALITLMRSERGSWGPLVVEAGYHDQSHFVRDCQLFLDMSMTAFAQRPKPLFEASVRLRAQVLGTPAQALHPVKADHG